MDAEISKLESHLELLARIITGRPDGERYIPIYERVEAELSARRARSNLLERIRARATAQPGSEVVPLRAAA